MFPPVLLLVLIIYVLITLSHPSTSLCENFLLILFIDSGRGKHLTLGIATAAAVCSPVYGVHFGWGCLVSLVEESVFIFPSVLFINEFISTVLSRVHILHLMNRWDTSLRF